MFCFVCFVLYIFWVIFILFSYLVLVLCSFSLLRKNLGCWCSKGFVFWLYIFFSSDKKISFCFKLFHLTTSCVFKAFRAWKKKKDELLNQQIAEKRKKEEKKRLDALMNERMRKSDAESAYLAWYSLYFLLCMLIWGCTL